MSRSYRIRIRETLRRVIRATDHVSSQLELLEILPPEQMAGLLAAELESRGFERHGRKVVRQDQGIRVTIDLESGEVTVHAESQQEVAITKDQEKVVYDTNVKVAKDQAREQLRKTMETEASQKAAALQKQVTDRLEGELADIKRELDQAVNRATAAALKQKAAQMGQIKAMTEDPNSGSLTIVVEV